MFELIPVERHNRRVSAWDPFRELEEMQRGFFSDAYPTLSSFRTDVADNGDSYLLEAELPGFSKEDIDIDIENDCLTITAEHKSDETEEKKNYIKRERFYGSYSRSFDVSSVNVDAIEASYSDGVLKLNMPKKPENVPASRKLEIR